MKYKKEREFNISCSQIVCAYYDGRTLNCCAGFQGSGSIIKTCLGYRPKKNLDKIKRMG